MTHYNYIDEDLLDRAQLREKYFEDKRYRKWSSVYPMRRVHYGARPERFFISDYLGITSYAIFEMNDLEFINTILKHPNNKDINWQAMFDYLNERSSMNDRRSWEAREMKKLFKPYQYQLCKPQSMWY